MARNINVRGGHTVSQPKSFYAKALTASEVTKALLTFAEQILTNDPVHLHVGTNLPGIDLDIRALGAALRSNSSLEKFSFLINKRRHIICIQGWVVNENNGNMKLGYATDDGIIANVTLQMNGDPIRLPKALDSVESLFKLTSYVDLVRSTGPMVDQSALAIRERSIADLESGLDRLMAFQAELTENEARRRERIQGEMDEAHRERLDKLENAYREKQASLDTTRADNENTLAKRVKEFEDRVAHYDLNEPKAKRRELLERIDKVLRESEAAKLSPETSAKRRMIHIACGSVFLVSLALLGSMLYMVTVAKMTDWHYFVGLGSGIIMFASTMIYYLKWNDQWFREHANTEFAAKRYKADILRASWIAELVQESTAAGQNEIPKEVIEAYTRNLFRDIDGSTTTEHPMDGLSGLMKRATEVNFGKGAFSLKAVDKEKH